MTIEFLHEKKAVRVDGEEIQFTDEEWEQFVQLLREKGICK